MSTTVIVGTQWGDEGKGKIVDYYAEDADYVVRYNGGSNAGHTIIAKGEKFKFHLVPSGIIRPDKIVVIGNGVVVDCEILLRELAEVKARGYKPNLYISERANLIMPYHKILDGLEENLKGSLKSGTTKRGIGPCYSDKVARFGIRVSDILDRKVLEEKLDLLLPIKERVLSAYNDNTKLSKTEILNQYLDYGEKIKSYVTDTAILINDAIAKGKNVLFEGAQGTHLDIDHGIYPFGTSSNTVAGGVCTGVGVGPNKIDRVVGVVKAYTSRVGEGPFPTEQRNEIGKYIQEKGAEFGTTTGRPRRCGWLDLVMVTYAIKLNALAGIVLTKIDVLGGLKTVKICKEYRCAGQTLHNFPANMKVLAECQPIYDEFEGWEDLKKEDWLAIAKKGYAALPENMRIYVEYIRKETGVPIEIVSVGAEREATIDLREG